MFLVIFHITKIENANRYIAQSMLHDFFVMLHIGMKNVTSIFTHVTSPYLPKRGDCIQPPLTYYIPETTGINNYSYYKNLSELNQYAEHLSRISRPFLHSFQSSFRFGNLRNQFFHRTVAFFHIINNRTEIGR